jgi:threonylcarbamoyladenosine tRNA methylthiotransferase MtaB
MGQQKKQAFFFSQLHTTQKVLIESSIENNMLSGYTENYLRVFVPYHPSLENSLAEVILQERLSEGCIGIVKNSELTAPRVSVSIPVVQAVVR